MVPHDDHDDDDDHDDHDDAAWKDDSAGDWDDDDSESGDQDPDDEPTVPCPYCRREILEDSPRCPFCGQYISAEDSPGPKKPFWVVATALICLAIALWLVFVAF